MRTRASIRRYTTRTYLRVISYAWFIVKVGAVCQERLAYCWTPRVKKLVVFESDIVRKEIKHKYGGCEIHLGNSHRCKLRADRKVGRAYLAARPRMGPACGAVTPLGDSTRVNRTIRYNHVCYVHGKFV